MVATKQLVIVVEGTSVLGPSWPLLRKEYIDKIIRAFCGYDNAGQKLQVPTGEMALIVYHSDGYHSGSMLQQSGWTDDMDLFLRHLASIQFGGGGFGETPVAEALAEALLMCCPDSAGTPAPAQGIDRLKHVVLVAASPPHRLPTPLPRPPLVALQANQATTVSGEAEQAWWLADAASLAQSFPQCAVSLSIISPRQMPALRTVYNQSKRIVRAAEPSADASRHHPQHLVLLSEGFLEARVALQAPRSSAPAVKIDHSNQNAPAVAAAAGAPLVTASISARLQQQQQQQQAARAAGPAAAVVAPKKEPVHAMAAQAQQQQQQQPSTSQVGNTKGHLAAAAAAAALRSSLGGGASTPPLGGSAQAGGRPSSAGGADANANSANVSMGMQPGGIGINGPAAMPPVSSHALVPPGMAGAPQQQAGMGMGGYNHTNMMPVSTAGPPALNVSRLGPGGGAGGGGLMQQQQSGLGAAGMGALGSHSNPGLAQIASQGGGGGGGGLQVPMGQQQHAPGAAGLMPAGVLGGANPGMSVAAGMGQATMQQQPNGNNLNNSGRGQTSAMAGGAGGVGQHQQQQQQGGVPMGMSLSQQGMQQQQQQQQQASAAGNGGYAMHPQAGMALPSSVMANGQQQQQQQNNGMGMGMQAGLVRQHSNSLSGISMVQQPPPQQQQQQQQQQPQGSSSSSMMMPTPGLQQQQQQQLQARALSSVGASGMTSMMPQQQQPLASQQQQRQQQLQAQSSQHPKYTKLWEGSLVGSRLGQPVNICKVEGYRQSTSPENLAADWPETMQIVRLIAQDYMSSKEYQGKAELLVFRPVTHHGFLQQMAIKKLCAVIQLPSQTLLIASVPDKPSRLIGMLFPQEVVVFRPQPSSSQVQQAQGRSQQQVLPGSSVTSMHQQQQQQQQQQSGYSGQMQQGSNTNPYFLN